MNKKELLHIQYKKIELRAKENDGNKYIVGIIPYNSESEDMFGFREVIAKGAFTKTIKENKIFALIDHNTTLSLGNSKNGTLTFEDTDEGLICTIQINEYVSFARDLYEQVSRQDVSGLSFGFNVIKEEWKDNNRLRILQEIRLFEISFGVVFPAYAETTSETQYRDLMTALSGFDTSKKQELYNILKSELEGATPSQEPVVTSHETSTQTTESGEPTKSVQDDNEIYEYKLKIIKLGV